MNNYDWAKNSMISNQDGLVLVGRTKLKDVLLNIEIRYYMRVKDWARIPFSHVEDTEMMIRKHAQFAKIEIIGNGYVIDTAWFERIKFND